MTIYEFYEMNWKVAWCLSMLSSVKLKKDFFSDETHLSSDVRARS